MRQIISLLTAFGIVLFAGCASAPSPDLSGSGPEVGELTIVSATYGSGSHVADVTRQVLRRLHSSDGEFYVSPQWLKADPIPGWNKELIINYKYAGTSVLFHAGENSRVTYKILLDHARGHKSATELGPT